MLIVLTTLLLSILLSGLTFSLGGKEESQTHSFSSESTGGKEFSVFCDARAPENGETKFPVSPFDSSTVLSEEETTARLGFLVRLRIERSSRKGPFKDMFVVKHPDSDLF
jgi:hypothetical protein